ncbi:MAG TPA: hypothetical protein VNQ33_10190 [Acidimicrobiales bacterium]|nr:hypothetical protein [Acidimicrobiales bacterium]
MTDPTPGPTRDTDPPSPESATVPVPTRRIVTVRNERTLRLGWAAVGIGIVLVVIGAAVGFGSQALQVAAAKGRAKVGNPVTFDADDGTTYAITLIPEPTTGDFVEDRISQLGCEVRHPDGTTESLDPSSAEVRTSNSIGVFATDFEGRGGSTTVLCEWERGDLGSFYAVARTHRATRYIGTGALVAGIVIGIGGVGALVRGYRGRPELQDIGTATDR